MSYKNLIYTTIFVLALLSSITFILSNEMLLQLSEEGRMIEKTTAFIFGCAAVLGAYISVNKSNKLWFLFTIFMVFACARELDFHKIFTSESIFKIKFYTNPEYLVLEKMISFVFVLILIGSMVTLFKYIPFLLKSLRQKSIYAWALSGALGSIVLAKMLDAKTRFIPFFENYFFLHDASLRFFEEGLELYGALLFILMALLTIKRGET